MSTRREPAENPCIAERPVREQSVERDTFLRALIESLPFDFLATDKSGRYTIQNSASINSWGEHVGRTLDEARPSALLLEERKRAYARAMSGEIVQEERTCKLNGEKRDYLALVAPVREGSDTVGVVEINVDVTSTKRSEAALRESQARYEELVDAVDGIVWEADPVTLAFSFVSKKAERLLGYRTEDWVGDPDFWPGHVHPDDRAFVLDFCGKMTAQARDHEVEYRMIAADGRVVWLRDIVTVTAENGRPVKLRGVMVDISESMRAAKIQSSIFEIAEAVSSAENLDKLFPAIHGIVAALMPAVNFQIALEDRSSGGIRFVYWRDERGLPPAAHAIDCARRVISTGEAVRCGMDEFERPQLPAQLELMEPAPASWLGVPLIAKSRTIGAMAVQRYSEGFRYSDEEKNILSMISWQVAMAIERKSVDDALRRSERRYRALVENSQGLICTHDLDGTLLSINATAATLLGYQPAAVIGKSLRNALARSVRHLFDDYLEEIRTAGRHSGVMRVLTRSGEERFFAYSNTVQNEPGRAPYVLGSAQDITDLRQIQRALMERARISELIAQISSYVTGRDSLESIIGKCAEVLAEKLGVALLRIWTKDPDSGALAPLATAGSLRTLDAGQIDEIFGNCDLDRVSSCVEPYSSAPIDLSSLGSAETAPGAFAGYQLQSEGRAVGLMALLTSNPLPNITLKSISSIGDTLAQFIERKKAEEALERSHNLLSSVIDGTTDAIFVKDLQGQYLMINQAGAAVSGRSPEYHVGRRDADLFSLDSTSTILESDKTVFATGETRTFEEVIEVRGERRTFLAKKGLYKDAAGNAVGLIGIARDITERIQTEEALRDSETLFRTLADTAAVGIYIYRENRVLYVNSAAEEISGYTRDEILRGDLFMMLHADSREVAIGNAEARQKGWVPRNGYDIKIISKDGQERWLNITGTLIKFKGETAVLLTAFDITQLRIAGDALAAEKERLAITLRSIADGVIATDTTGKVVLFNQVAEVMTGCSQEEALGAPIADILRLRNLKTRRSKENPVERLLRGVSDKLHQSIVVSRDGVERIIADTAAPIRNKDAKLIGFVLVLRDITESRKLEEEMLRASKLDSVGLLAGGIAHDFNNILTSILGNISFAKTVIKNPDKVVGRLDAAEHAALRARDLTQQLLTFSKGGAPIKKTVHIAQLVRESSNFALTGSSVLAEFLLPKDLWPTDIDEGQIGQVIHNLVLNAQQATPDGGTITVKAENVELAKERGSGRLLPRGRYIKIGIIDRGAGISGEHIDKIFDPYFTTKENGSGLGLATSYSIVKNHGGLITVKSRLGEGSSFTVYLHASANDPAQDDAGLENQGMDTGRVLVMDDEDILRELMQQVLTHLGYETVQARDGAEAIDLFKKAVDIGMPFDAVILDLTIPGGMGGKDVIKRLIEIDPGVRAIVSSGYSNDPVMADFKKYGFKGVMIKPYKGSELSKALRDVLRRG